MKKLILLFLVSAGVICAQTAAPFVQRAQLLTSGRVPYVTANGLVTDSSTLLFNSGTGALTATTFTSTVATGTAPFTVASTTLVTNLHAATADSSTSTTTATNATNTAITDDTSTNATMFPTWVTAATGNLPQKVSSTLLTFNPSTGIVVAPHLTLGSTTSLLLGTAGSAVGNIGFRNATSGTATLAPPTGALGTYTVTLPNAASTLPIFGQQITFAGPTIARTITLLDAAYTTARQDAAQTFTGVQSFTSPDFTTSVTTPSTSFTAFAGATTLMTIGGTGASASSFFPSTLDTSSSITGAIRTSGGISAAKALNIGTTGTFGGSVGITTSLTTPSTTFALLNATATTVNAFGAATTVNTGASATQIWNFGGSTTASEFRFLEPSGSGTNYSAFKAVAQSANITYSLPATVGAAGTFLRDAAGNGVLDWAAGATISGLTTTAIVTANGTTAVQTPSPTSTMDASGNVSLAGTLTVGNAATTAGAVALTQGTTQSAGTTNITIQAPTSVTSYVMTLPGAVGGAGTVLTDAAGNGVLSWAAGGGTGTVTHTGNLTSNAVVLGNGTADTKVVAGITTDGTSIINLGVNATTIGKVKMFGNTSGDATIQPAAVAGTSTVVTLPNASSTLPIFGQQITFTGPSTARTITLLDAVYTTARQDAAQTFTGVQSFTSPDFTTSVTTPSTSFTAWAGATTLLTIGGTGASASMFAPSTLDATTSTTGAIRTSGGISAAKALNVGTTITGGGALSIGTSNAATVGTVELGAASDTTVSRSAAGVIAVEGNIVSMVGPRITALTSSATPTFDIRTCDVVNITALAVDITSMTTNMTNTGVQDFQQLEFRILGTAARAITWGANFASGIATLPTTTTTTKTLYAYFEYDSVQAKWMLQSTGSYP